jgi:hypothetical protein
LPNPIGTMHPRTLWADEGTFQVEAKDSVLTADQANRLDHGAHPLGNVSDQSWQARRRSKAAVRAGNGTHAVSRRLIVEKDSTAAVDLQIDEPRREQNAGGKTRLRAIRRNLAPRRNSDDALVSNQDRRVAMPDVAVKDAVGEDSMPMGDGRIVSSRAHRYWGTWLDWCRNQSNLG